MKYALLALVALAAAPLCLDPYVNDDREFRHALILRESQEGCCGTSVRTYFLGKKTWGVTDSFIDDEGKVTRTPWKSGTLSRKQTFAVYEVLRENRLLKLPASMGKESKVNAHVYELSFGGKNFALHGVPPHRRGKLADHIRRWLPAGREKEGERFSLIAQAIVDKCKPE